MTANENTATDYKSRHFRVIESGCPNESLFEDGAGKVHKESLPVSMLLPELAKDKIGILKVVAGAALIMAGMWGAGTYYSGTFSHLYGVPALLFYNCQLGTVMCCVGTVLIYDSIRKLMG